MVNVDKLKDKIIEKNMTIEGLSIDLNINRSTLYRKFKSTCDNMTIKEARAISELLELSKEEVSEIFFA